MKKWIVMLAMLSLLTACAQTPEPESAELTELSAATSESAEAEETAVSQQTSAPTATPIATPEPTATPAPTPSATPAATPTPTSAPTPEPTAAPTAEHAPAQVSMSYGAVPFDLAAGTEQWWSIDSSDSAYWAVQENINAMRAAGGLAPLTMDGGLSAAADARCESFVAGGPFDHSGMTTRSEICAAGPLGSASAVCTGWQGSPAHYANIMEPSFTSMGVGCWFCQTAEGQYKLRYHSAKYFPDQKYKDDWETIIGNCDSLVYLGGNDYSTFEYISKLLGKQTIRTKGQSIGKGSHGSSSDSYQVTGRELMTPDEVRRMKRSDCLVMISGEAPVRDKKYNLFDHPNLKYTPDYRSPRGLLHRFATPIPAPDGYTMPPDYMAQAGTVSLAYVAELTCPEITEDLYDELQEWEESLL